MLDSNPLDIKTASKNNRNRNTKTYFKLVMPFVLCILKHVRQPLYSDIKSDRIFKPECFMLHPFDYEKIGYSCQSIGH